MLQPTGPQSVAHCLLNCRLCKRSEAPRLTELSRTLLRPLRSGRAQFVQAVVVLSLPGGPEAPVSVSLRESKGLDETRCKRVIEAAEAAAREVLRPDPPRSI